MKQLQYILHLGGLGRSLFCSATIDFKGAKNIDFKGINVDY